MLLTIKVFSYISVQQFFDKKLSEYQRPLIKEIEKNLVKLKQQINIVTFE